MRTFLGASLVAVSAAISMTPTDLFIDCTRNGGALLDCYNTYLAGGLNLAPVEPEEPPSVVEEPHNDEPTGRVLKDRGVETYRRTFAETFPFATVDFNKSESRDNGQFLFGLRENYVTEDKNEHYYAEPAMCSDPCFESS